MALYSLLLEYRESNPLKLAVAHIDHGWREESGFEANILEELAKKHNHPFHLKKLLPLSKGNTEERAREERLQFYTELCSTHGYQAVLLAHHANDQAETVLKRVFEGANLSSLAGMQQVSSHRSIQLWRPLLNIEKATLIEWLEKKGTSWFNDKTNLDPCFLRGRLRSEILPFLSETFGKNAAKNFIYLGEEARELDEYLQGKITPLMETIEEGKWGIYLDLCALPPIPIFELRFLIKKFCERNGTSISRDHLKIAVECIQSKAGNKKISLGKKMLMIDRGSLFLPILPTEDTWELQPLLPNSISMGPWKVVVEKKTEKGIDKSGWKSLWKGECEVYLPAGDYKIGSLPVKSTLSKWWTNHKVPAFLRDKVPVIWENSQIYYEFLSGKKLIKEKKGPNWLKVSLSLDL